MKLSVLYLYTITHITSSLAVSFYKFSQQMICSCQYMQKNRNQENLFIKTQTSNFLVAKIYSVTALRICASLCASGEHFPNNSDFLRQL